MLPSNNQAHWDIFCNVIDNYGDIGVCWRLARQLASEHGLIVRLWVDQLEPFRKICPEIDPEKPCQTVQGVDVRRWEGDFPDVVPGDVVIEAFACHLPERFIEAMTGRSAKPVWLNLDYLSAEAWVAGCHALPSPHPRLPLTKYFFFPGFNKATGGLLRERDLEERRQAFLSSPERIIEFWREIDQPPPPAGAVSVSLFAYENPALKSLLDVWMRGNESICCFAPATRTLPDIESFVGRRLQAGDHVHCGNLEIRVLPFLSQTDYDHLLWLCDINIVRGEDSFVRAQWAARPMLWHIYPQEDEAHQVKLAAFLEVYCSGLSAQTAATVREFHSIWNGASSSGQIKPELWEQWRGALPDLSSHAIAWANIQSKQEDLCSSLVRFCRSKL